VRVFRYFRTINNARFVLGVGLVLGLIGCGLVPTSTLVPSQAPPTGMAAGQPTAAGQRPEETILILSPGPGSRLTSPIHLQGMSDPTFEQTLAVRLLADNGSQLASVSTTIQADAGQRGAFKVDIPFSVGQTQQGFLQVFATSPRDGGVTHLASVGVQLASGGSADIHPAEPHAEQIAIRQPQPGETVSGGRLHVAGFGLGGFEQTLVIDIYDAEGNQLAEQPVMVKAPDLGQPGPFEADLSYTLAQPGPGRVVVRDVSPAFGGDTHLMSVEVRLQP
jgi:hypothetical protein